MSDLISRQAAIDAIVNTVSDVGLHDNSETARYGATYRQHEIITILKSLPSAQPHWIPCSERLPSKEERKEWIDNNLDGIGYLYPCLVTRYSIFNSDRAKNNPYVAKHYFDGEDFLNAGEEVCSEYIIAWMPLPDLYKGEQNE